MIKSCYQRKHALKLITLIKFGLPALKILIITHFNDLFDLATIATLNRNRFELAQSCFFDKQRHQFTNNNCNTTKNTCLTVGN